MRQSRRAAPRLWAMALLPALAVLPAARAEGGPGGWVPVDEAVLDEARGGFDTGNGLLVSLELDRMISLNGNVVGSSRLALADVAGTGGAPSSGFSFVAAGDGNAVSLATNMQTMAALVLQNSANDQLIRSQTTINATVNTLSTLKGLNFGDSLRQALSTAVVPR
ncbi:hypothetical protein [Pseudoduganella lurida]|nr:hypothetical protein [Pseudoduganella lurida]